MDQTAPNNTTTTKTTNNSNQTRRCPCQQQINSNTKKNQINSQMNRIKSSQSDENTNILCPTCIENYMMPYLQLQKEATRIHEKKRDWCIQQFELLKKEQEELYNVKSNTCTNVTELNHKLNVVRKKVGTLRQVRRTYERILSKQQMEHKSLEQQLREDQDMIVKSKHTLSTIYDHCLIQDMSGYIYDTGLIKEVSYKRFMYALQMFGMHRIEVGIEHYSMSTTDTTTNSNNNDDDEVQRRKVPSGIGKIAGLVLPHAGPALYGALPPYLLASALRFVASCTVSIARCLGIVLPHPIFLRTSTPSISSDIDECSSDQDITQTVSNGDTSFTSCSNDNMIQSSSSFSTLLITSAGRALARATGIQQQQQPTTTQPSKLTHNMDEFSIAKRIQHATYAVLRESNHNTKKQPPHSIPTITEYDLRPPNWNTNTNTTTVLMQQQQEEEEHFAIGLQFLQNDVIALCIRAGVPVDDLWPAEAILLNLYSLKIFCQSKVTTNTTF